MREVAGEAKALTEELAQVDAELTPALAQLPNLPEDVGGPQDTVIKEVGEAWVPDFEVRDHLSSPATASTWSAARACRARASPTCAATSRGWSCRSSRWAMDQLAEHGFEPVIPPVLVREEALYGTGFLPDTEQQIYQLADDDLYLVGTSEVALASLHAGEILDGDDAAAPLRRVLALLPPRGRRRRQGHARHLPRAPVRQGRDVQLRRA